MSSSSRLSYPVGVHEPSVRVGQRLEAGEVIAVRRHLSPTVVVDAPTALKRPSKSVSIIVTGEEGTRVEEGQPIARATGRFGIGSRELLAPVAGTVVASVAEDGLLVIRPADRQTTVTASTPSTVAAVAENRIDVEVHGSLIRGAAATGEEVFGLLGMVHPGRSISDAIRNLVQVADAEAPRIIVFPRPVDLHVIQMLRDAYWDPRPIAILAPCMDYREFSRLREKFGSISALLTEGFAHSESGCHLPQVFTDLLESRQGQWAAVLPAAENRCGLLVLDPEGGPCTESGLEKPSSQATTTEPLASTAIRPGVTVRCLRELELSAGLVTEILDGERGLESGYVARLARVVFPDGVGSLLPLDNLEIIARPDQA